MPEDLPTGEGEKDRVPVPRHRKTRKDGLSSGRHRAGHKPLVTASDLQTQDGGSWWRDRGIAQTWSEGETINIKTRFAIQDTLARSQLYQGLSSDSSILDLGVGARTYLEPDMIPQGAHVHAADLSTEMLSRLEKNSPDFYESFTETDARSLKFPPNNFDRIVSTLMMRYLTNEEQEQAILEMIRTARPGAQIHVIDFDNVENYPHQKALFDPNRLLVQFHLSGFQTRLQALGKRIDTVSATEIPRDFEGSKGHLHYMTINVGH